MDATTLGDDEPYISQEAIERLKSADARWQAIDLAIRVDDELRNSVIWPILLAEAGRNAEAAMQGLALVNPADTKAIIGLQAKAHCAKFIAEVMESVRVAALTAQQSLEDEGNVELNEEAVNG